jgi:hypothetical protein
MFFVFQLALPPIAEYTPNVDAFVQGHVVIIELIPGTPADMSGQLLSGDVIEQADGQTLMGMYMADVVALISVCLSLPAASLSVCCCCTLPTHAPHSGHCEQASGSKDWMLLCPSCRVLLMPMCSRRHALLRALQGGPKASGTFVCLRLLRDSAARITVRILRQDKMEIVPKPQPSVRPQVGVRVCIPKLTLDR